MDFVDIIDKIIDWVKVSIPRALLLYMFWILVHYISSHLYIHWCAGNTFIGFILSPIYSSAPHCQALSWTIYTTSRQFVVMWIALGTYLCEILFLKKNEIKEKEN